MFENLYIFVNSLTFIKDHQLSSYRLYYKNLLF